MYVHYSYIDINKIIQETVLKVLESALDATSSGVQQSTHDIDDVLYIHLF